MQSQASKIVLAITIITIIAIIAGSSIYLLQPKQTLYAPLVTKNEEYISAWRAIVKYNCEQSGGTFAGDRCKCPFEAQLGQTSDSMYDRTTGQCQTTLGGPGGELGRDINQCIGLRLELDECKKK